MRRTSVLAVVALLTVGLVGACTDATGGQAVPNGGGNETSSGEPTPSSGSAEPTAELPPRPKELSLDGLEPCSVLTEAQIAQIANDYKFDAPPATDTEDGSAVCSLEQTADPFNVIDILLVTNRDVEQWLTGENNVDAWPVSIAGYPAVGLKFLGTEDVDCATSVGVADGQNLLVDYQPLEPTDYRELCRVTEQIATMATETLKTLR